MINIKESSWNQILSIVKHRIFIYLTKGSTQNLFVRSGDALSVDIQVNGIYDPQLTSLLKHLSESEKNSDFFIDIGANIGVISCQVGKYFDNLVCFEPNPICVRALKLNLSVVLPTSEVDIREYALGEKDGVLPLLIPGHNLGGAFVYSDSQSYSEELLAKKDGFGLFNKENYNELSIEVRDAKLEMENLFLNLSLKGKEKGVIKIDTKGFELPIIYRMVDAIPTNVSVFIVFENWDENLDIDKLLKAFKRRGVKKIQRLNRTTDYGHGMRKYWLFFKGLIFSRQAYLEDIEISTRKTGDIVIYMPKQ